MIYVIGGDGFVGSAFIRLLTRLGIDHASINRDNYDRFVGTTCSLVINANGNSKKYIADRDPLRDFDESVRSVVQSLEDFRCQRYVFLSSGDVYPDPSGTGSSGEDVRIDPALLGRYGLHKFLAEQTVRSCCTAWLIFRMSGFCGPGLKKNAIFDMLRGEEVRLSAHSELQFISTDRAAALMWDVITSGVSREVINVGASGVVALQDVWAKIGSSSVFAAGAPHIRYELNIEKLEKFTDIKIPDTKTEVNAFVEDYMIN